MPALRCGRDGGVKYSFMTTAIRKTAPGPLAPVAFEIPKPHETMLQNGLRVVLFEDKRLPLVSFRLAFLSGDAGDPPDSVGLTSAMAAMLTEGTENYSSRELAEKVERLGAHLSANASDDFTILSASALSLYTADIVELMAEVLLRPIFPESELDLYKRNTVENLKFQRSQPGFLANEQVARLLYGEHPYSRVAPTAEDIEKLSRESLVDFHRRTLIPNNAILIIVGDAERDELLGLLHDKLHNWQSGPELPRAEGGVMKDESEGPSHASSSIRLPSQPSGSDRRSLTIVDRAGSAQSNIVIANRAFERNSPDYFAALVMNQVLGAGASSRVFMNLREEKGYTYGAYTRLDLKKLAGDFEATAEVRTPVTGDSLKEFFYELNRIRDERVSDEELTDAKNFLTGVFPIRAETQEGLTNLIVNQQLYGLADDYLQTYRDNVNAITAEDVQRVAREYITPDKMSIVIVGDGAELVGQATPFAESVEIFDTEGQPRDIAVYNSAPDAPTADVAGSWKLMLDFQGQQVPVSLTVDQDGESITGKLETVLGNGTISEGSAKGRKLSATANTEIQGQTVDLLIAGTVDGDSMSGTISAAIIPDTLTFTGKREG